MKEKERLKRDERKQYMLDKLLSLQVRVTMTGKYFFTWQVGAGADRIAVCRAGFEMAYQVSRWYTDDLISRMKDGDVNVEANFTDRTAIDKSGINDARVIAFCKHFGIALSRKQIRALKIPNSMASLSTVAWMNYFFKLMADNVPNIAEELHLEPVKKDAVYEEYCFDVSGYSELTEPISRQLFLEIWRTVFAYVKVRKFKQCCGKCNLCSYLSELRRKFTDARGREEVARFFEVHRMTYMGEREGYYARRHQAMMEPWNFLSTITDGMQQNRCLLPWYGHKKQPPKHLKQHLQGILMHGRQLRIYRSFSNVVVNANYCVHTWLLSLEEQYKDGKLPPVLYHQIDGGSENANILYLAICFMLVAKGLCLKVVLTRLLPGHTHEDIDALFALIWNMVRDEIILTPSEFEAAILLAFKKIKDVKVVDIHACPNYSKYFNGYIDTEVGRFAKEEWTQLQMTFERVGEDERERYPHLVKTTYKAYDQDEVVEIVDDPAKESITGLIPQLTLCPVCPSDDEPPFCVLKAIPGANRTIEVDPFNLGSRAFTAACCDTMERTYANKKPEVAAEWIKWRDEVAPQSDIATDYIAEHPMHIPFLEQLFSGAVMSDYEVDARSPRAPSRIVNGKALPDMRVVTAVSSVLHAGDKKKKRCSRIVVETVEGENVSDQNIPALAHLTAAPRKPRAKKAATKKAASKKAASKKAASKKAASKKAAPKKAVPKKKTIVEESEEEEEAAEDEKEEESASEEDSDEEAVDVECIDGPCDVAAVAEIFNVGDRIKNALNLRGTVVECHDNGTYTVHYSDGQKDFKLKAHMLTRIPPGLL